MTESVLFLIALAVFGIGFAIERFVAVKNPVLSAAVGIAAGIMGILALVKLF